MAAVALDGGDGRARVAAGASAGGRGRNQRGGRCRGCRGALGALQQQRRQAGGGQARGRAQRAHAPRPSGERRETTGIGQLGWAGSWAAQVSGPGTNSLSLCYLICSVFLFILFCFELVKYQFIL